MPYLKPEQNESLWLRPSCSLLKRTNKDENFNLFYDTVEEIREPTFANTTILRLAGLKNVNLLGELLHTLETTQSQHNLVHFCSLVMSVLGGNGDADC